jgi:hypothetical protein
MDMFTVRSTDPVYNSPMIGNGEVVTALGPTGYHGGPCPAEEVANRTIFWAGRRLRDAADANVRIPRVAADELIGPTRPLVRFGRLVRTLTIDGAGTADEDWEQALDYDCGTVISTLDHGPIREQTRSLVCLTANVMVFRTRLENRGDKPARLVFTLAYEFGDAEGFCTPDTRLRIRRPHPDDAPFGDVEGYGARGGDLEGRPPHLLESLSVKYEVNGQLGEVHIGRYPLGEIRETQAGGRFTHRAGLQPGEAADLWFWVALSDRLKYTHFPDFERVQELVAAHERAWAEFWDTSRVEFGDSGLEALLRASLYTIRCNVSPWSIPPGYLSTIWEGRTFHDEFYPCIALLSANHPHLAERVPNYRLLTLPVALQRGAGWGAHYSWEATEEGEESAPYGHWTDEEFRHGEFSEAIWRYYLYTGDLVALARYYPVLRGCAEWLIHDVLVRDKDGLLKTRPITDVDEVIYPVANSIFVHCATVRALENAACAAELLDMDAVLREGWRSLAAELRQTLPVDETGARYRYADDAAPWPDDKHVPMVFPFSFDVHDARAHETLRYIYAAGRAQWLEWNWIWAISRLATAFFYQGRGDEGYAVLRRTLGMAGPFMAPNEHYREDKGPYLPWLTTAAGAFVHAVYAMFVRVVDGGAPVLLYGLPSTVQDARFERLLASRGVAISGRIDGGRLVHLMAQSDRAMLWDFRVPQRFALDAPFAPGLMAQQPDCLGLVTVECALEQGVTQLVGEDLA